MPPGPAAPPPPPPPEPRGRAHPPGPAAAPGAVPTQRPASPGHPPPAGQDPAGSPSVTVPPPPRAKPRRLGHPVGAAPLYGGLAAFEGRGGGNKAGRKASVAGFGARGSGHGPWDGHRPGTLPTEVLFQDGGPREGQDRSEEAAPRGGILSWLEAAARPLALLGGCRAPPGEHCPAW